MLFSCYSVFLNTYLLYFLNNYIFYYAQQNDVSDIPDLTFSMDPDEEKHILYEKNEVYKYFNLNYLIYY